MEVTSGVATCLHLRVKVIEYMFQILLTRAVVKDIINIKVISTKTNISMFQLEADNLNHTWFPSLRKNSISGIDVPSKAIFQWLMTETWTVTGVSLGWPVGPWKVPPVIHRFPICDSFTICVTPIAELIFHLSNIACDCKFVWLQRRKVFSLVEWQRVILYIIRISV